MDDGPNDAVVFGRASERGLHLDHRRANRRHCRRPPDDCLEFPDTVPRELRIIITIIIIISITIILMSISKKRYEKSRACCNDANSRHFDNDIIILSLDTQQTLKKQLQIFYH